jgi:L-ascorbate metabolism protein UlaG (beta-lactamase superfamily)
VGLTGLGGVVYRAAPNLLREMARETREPMTQPPAYPKAQAWPDTGLHAAWIGHSTVLLKIDGFTILTDPIFSDRAGVRVGPVTFGIKRMVAPAVAIRQLPKIDLILLSHAHMDHFDLPSLRALENRGTTVVTAANTADLLRVRRYRRVHELAWGESARIGDVECTAFEVKHWGARMRNDTFRGYNGYVLDTGRRRVLFAGDTALTPSFRALRSSRPVDLAIMPIGSYDPWVRNHCTPEQAWRMANDAGAEFLLPVHHQTFRLSREPRLEPIERFYAAACSQTRRIVTHAIGQEFHLA